jgi:thiamine biosynthesis lipoprotein
MFAFRAMNTDVSVSAPGAHEAAVATAVAGIFAAAERRFSRFRVDSELSWLNRTQGPVEVSPELFAALARARHYTEVTGGIFDPGIGGALIALGYDRSFAPGALDRPAASPSPGGCFLGVRLDPDRRVVDRPAAVQIDLGGMIKGRTVDAAGALLAAAGAIDAGGDAVLRGDGPEGAGWIVEIEDPRAPGSALAAVRVVDGAVATSAANRRCWRVADAAMHHLIDPRTQRPASTDLLQATVFAPTAELADVLAKTAFLLGAGAARRFLAGRGGVGAVLVPRLGGPIVLGDVDVVRLADA